MRDAVLVSLWSITCVWIITESAGSAAPLEQEWSYSDPGTGIRNSLAKVLLDKNGNILLIGRFANTNEVGELVLTKLDPRGKSLWTARFADGSSLWGVAMVLDAAGDAVIAANATKGVALLRFDGAGNRQWQKYLSSSGQTHGYGVHLAMDSEEKLWVTGDQGTFKLDRAGSELWSKTNVHGTELQPLPGGRMAALESSGVLLLEPNGNIAWRTNDFVRRNPFSKASSYAARLATDAIGSIFVGGVIEDALVVAKHAPDGQKLWQTEYQGQLLLHETQPSDYLVGLCLHPAGGVYVAGASKGAGDQDFDSLTMKLDADGKMLWKSRERGTRDRFTRSLAVDAVGNAFVSGSYSTYSNSVWKNHTLLTKYDPNGSRLWLTDNETISVNGGLLLVEDGKILECGTLVGTNSSGLSLIQFREQPQPATPMLPKPLTDRVVAEGDDVTISVSAIGTGPLSYQWKFNDAPIEGATRPDLTIAKIRAKQTGDYSVEVRSGESSIVSSDATVTVSTIPAIYAQPQPQSAVIGGQAQFSVAASSTTAQSIQWLKDGQPLLGATNASIILTNLQPAQDGLYHAQLRTVGGVTNSQPARLRVFTSARQAWKTELSSTNFPLGNPTKALVDVAGNFILSTGDKWSVNTVVKLDSQGNRLWEVPQLRIAGLALDRGNNLYFAGNDGTSSVRIGKLSPAGQFIWTTNSVLTSDLGFYVSGFALDQSNNVFIAGLANGAFLVAKWDGNGNHLWTKTQGVPLEAVWAVTSFALGPEGQVYVTGLSGEQVHGSARLVAFNTNGEWLWTARLGDADYWPNQTAKAVVDTAGSVSVFFGGLDPKSLFLVSYDAAGRQRWSVMRVFESATFYAPVDVAVAMNGDLVVAGYISGSPNEWITARFDTVGRELWSASAPVAPDQRTSGLNIDGRGHAYFSGGNHYDENGILIWSVNHLAVSASASAVGASGNLYAASTLSTGAQRFIEVAKYEPTMEGESFHFISPLPSRVIVAGDTLQFEATVQSTFPLRFQWTMNGAPLADQTNSTIRLTNIGLNDAGRMGIEVYGPSGLLAFPEFTVTVATKPVITVPPQSIDQVLGGAVRFTVSAQGTSKLSYQWQFNGNDLPGETNPFLILTNVTASSSGDYRVKVSALGAEILSDPAHLTLYSGMEQTWVGIFDNPSPPFRSAQHVTLDREGNVYVLGATGQSFANDFTVLCYTRSGTMAWSRTYAFGASASGGIAGYAWDHQDQLIIAGSRDYADAAIVKMTRSGATLWQTFYNGPNNAYDAASAVAVDGDDNAYVTGLSGDSYGTIKLDPQGRQLWVQRFTEPVSRLGGRAIALNNSGQVFVAGSSGTLRYDSDGQLTWSALGYHDRAIGVDANQNILVVGRSLDTNAPPGFVLRKYSPAGDLVWKASHGLSQAGAEPAHVLFFGEAGSVYVAGQAGLFKFDTDGRELWSVTNTQFSAAVRYRGGVVATGDFVGENGQQYLTQAFDAAGQREWTARFKTFFQPDYLRDNAVGVAADNEGRVYVTGRSGGNVVTIRYSPADIIELRLFGMAVGVDGNLTFILQAPIGRQFRIQTSEDMVRWIDWFAGRTLNSSTSFSDQPGALGERRKYYRAILE